jgi:hypothetical protein
MEFYLGTHVINHMEKTDVPLFISFRQLRKRKKKPFKQQGKISVDSGGFTELNLFGEWKTTPLEYVEELHRLQELGLEIEWASPQDWMCEEFVLEKTGLTIEEHQKRTVQNLIKLRSMTDKIHFIPVLQGQSLQDYFNHFEMYEIANFDLRKEKVVGVGSVCRRQSTDEIGKIFNCLSAKGVNLHGFGVKMAGISKYGDSMFSSDSLAWSYGARFSKKRCSNCMIRESPPKNCANCLEFALEWREKIITLT